MTEDHDHEDTQDEGLDARARIAESLDGLLDRETLNVLLKEVLAVTKQSRGWCPNCKKAVQLSIPDSKAVVSAMSELLVQGKGRPGTEPETGEQTVVNLYYILGDEVRHNGKVVDDPEEAARIIERQHNGTTD